MKFFFFKNEAFFAAFPEVFGAMLNEALTKSNYQMNSVYNPYIYKLEFAQEFFVRGTEFASWSINCLRCR